MTKYMRTELVVLASLGVVAVIVLLAVFGFDGCPDAGGTLTNAAGDVTCLF